MKDLTKAEENIMQVLWRIERGFVKDIIHELPAPKPKYSTVSTVARILEEKGFVGHKAYGKSHQYYPLVSKEDYSKASLKRFMKSYFDGSFKNLVHFFSQQKDLDLKEVNEIIGMLEKITKEGKRGGKS